MTDRRENVAVLEAADGDIDPGKRLTVSATPDTSEKVFVDAVAASKFSDLTYEVMTDGTTRYGEGPVPPTDIDDLTRTFIPALEFNEKMKVIVRNPGSQTRKVAVQIRGWEPL